jgi:hypothetical protein
MNMHMNRRTLLANSSIVAIGLTAVGIVGCAGLTTNQVLSQAAADANAIAQGLKNILPQIGALAGVSPATVATVGQAIADIQTVAAAITGATTAGAAQPSVVQLETDLNAIVAALASLTVIPPPISTALMAASILLPLIETAVGMVVPAQASLAMAKAVRTSAPITTELQARNFLNGL